METSIFFTGQFVSKTWSLGMVFFPMCRDSGFTVTWKKTYVDVAFHFYGGTPMHKGWFISWKIASINSLNGWFKWGTPISGNSIDEDGMFPSKKTKRFIDGMYGNPHMWSPEGLRWSYAIGDSRIGKKNMENNWLVVYLPLWKIWKSVGMTIPNIYIYMEKIVPNHQPDN